MIDEKTEEQRRFFANRLKKRFRHLWKWARRLDISAFRVYHRDIPELPFAVDWYDGHLHVAEFERPHDRTPEEHDNWIDVMTKTAADALTVPMNRVFVKRRIKQSGPSQYTAQAETHYELVTGEYGLRFKVNLSDYIDTGLFLDHRDLRKYVGERSSDRSVLNLFAYTGAFTVYAVAGGSRHTVSVDLSNTYLAWAKENLELNGCMGPEHELVRADGRTYPQELARSGRRFDIIILDPPTFSNSKKMDGTFDVQRDHAGLIRTCLTLLKPGGELIFSTNRRNFRLQEDGLAGARIRKITKLTMPEDFAGTGIHQAWSLQASAATPARRPHRPHRDNRPSSGPNRNQRR